MAAMTRIRRQAILRQATGYIELGELLVDAATPLPASARRVFERALEMLAELPEPTRSLPHAKLLEGEALRALGRWDEALVPLRTVTEAEADRIAGARERRLWQRDEPLADPAPLNVLYISQLAREQGIKVLLSGSAGDDLFTG